MLMKIKEIVNKFKGKIKGCYESIKYGLKIVYGYIFYWLSCILDGLQRIIYCIGRGLELLGKFIQRVYKV